MNLWSSTIKENKTIMIWRHNDPARNDHTDSKFSWNKLEVAHPLLPENTGRISHLSRPPLNEYLCLKTELQRSLLTSPKPRVAWEITGYDWPLYHITSGNIFTMRGHKCYGTPIDLNSTGPQFNRSSALVSCLMYEGEGLGRHHHEHLLEGKWLWKWSWLLWTSLGRKHHSNSVQEFFHVIYLDWWSLVGEGGSPRPLPRVHYIVKGSCCCISTPGHKPPAPHQDL